MTDIADLSLNIDGREIAATLKRLKELTKEGQRADKTLNDLERRHLKKRGNGSTVERGAKALSDSNKSARGGTGGTGESLGRIVEAAVKRSMRPQAEASTARWAPAAYAEGGIAQGPGMVRGPGGPRDDKIPAMLSNGEAVIPAKAAAQNSAVIHALLNGQKINHYQDGMAGAVSGSMSNPIIEFGFDLGQFVG